MKLINGLLALCISSGLVYWWATDDYAPNQSHEGMDAQIASISPNDLDRSAPFLDTQETQSLPVVSLYRYLPGAYAGVLNSCDITRELAPRLRPIISELANKKFRRSLYFVRALSEGAVISKDDIRRVRPGFGLPPKYFDWVVGKKVNTDVDFGDPVTLDVLVSH